MFLLQSSVCLMSLHCRRTYVKTGHVITVSKVEHMNNVKDIEDICWFYFKWSKEIDIFLLTTSEIKFEHPPKSTSILFLVYAFINNETLSRVKSIPEKRNSEKYQNVIFTVCNSENIDFYSTDKSINHCKAYNEF